MTWLTPTKTLKPNYCPIRYSYPRGVSQLKYTSYKILAYVDNVS